MSVSVSTFVLPSNIFVQWNLSFTRENENGHLKTACIMVYNNLEPECIIVLIVL